MFQSVHSKIWDDNLFYSCNKPEKVLFLYFLTNENRNLINLYECPDIKILAQTGVTKPELESAKIKFQKAGSAFFKDGYVFLPKGDRYQSFNNMNHRKNRDKLLALLRPEIKEWRDQILAGIVQLELPVEELKKKKKGLHEFDKSELNDEVCQEIAEKYSVKLSDVLKKRDDLETYCKSKGVRYADFKATLMGFIRRDLDKGVLTKIVPKEVSKYEVREKTPEEVEKSRRAAEKVREQMKELASSKII